MDTSDDLTARRELKLVRAPKADYDPAQTWLYDPEYGRVVALPRNPEPPLKVA